MVIAFLFGISNALLGMKRIAWPQAGALDALGLAVSGAVTMLILITSYRLTQLWLKLAIGMWITTSFLALAGFLVACYRTCLGSGLATRWLEWRDPSTHLGERVRIVDAGQMAHLAAGFFRQGEPGKALNIIGRMADD